MGVIQKSNGNVKNKTKITKNNPETAKVNLDLTNLDISLVAIQVSWFHSK